MKPNIWRLERALTLPPVSTLSSSYRVVVGSAEEGGLANIFPNIHHAPDTADRRDQQYNALWYLDNEHLLFCKADITAKSLKLNIIYLNLLYTTFYILILYIILYILKKVKEGSQNENVHTKMKFLHLSEKTCNISPSLNIQH